MEKRLLDLKMIKSRVKELEVLESRIQAGQDVEQLVDKARVVCIRLGLHFDDYKRSLKKEYRR